MDSEGARKTILSRRAKFVAATIAAAGIAIVDESRSAGAAPGDARDAGAVDAQAANKRSARDGSTPTTAALDGGSVLEQAVALHHQGLLIEAIALLRKELDAATIDAGKKGTASSSATTARLREVLLEFEQGLPTIIFRAHDNEGREIAIPLLLDGVPIGVADGHVMPINPGKHVLAVAPSEDGGAEGMKVDFIVREAEKGRIVDIAQSYPRPCLVPLRREDVNEAREPRASSHGCTCDVPGMKQPRPNRD